MTFSRVAQISFRVNRDCSVKISLMLSEFFKWIGQKNKGDESLPKVGQELHASPHIEHTPILSYPYNIHIWLCPIHIWICGLA